MLLINGVVYTCDGTVFEQGYVRFEGGKIADTGPMDALPSASGEVFDAGGMYITPGLIDAHCHLGMFEDALDFEGDDGNESTDPVTPQLRAIDAVNPQDRCFADALRAGITAVVTGPGSANPIGGQMAAMKTWGRLADDMIIKAPAAHKFALGENPKRVYHPKGNTPKTRMATAALIRGALLEAQAYLRSREKEEKFHFKWESLAAVLDGTCPVHIHAHRADDIATALRIAREFSLDMTLVHATDGAFLAQELAALNTPVILGPILCDRSKPELKSLSVETPGLMAKAGVRVALCTDFPVIPIEHLPLCAALAMRAGMTFAQALASVTSIAADNAGLADRVGRLKPGLEADVVVWNAPPLSFEAKAEAVFINGVRRA